MVEYVASWLLSFTTKQGRCDVQVKKILSYIALPFTFIIAWLIGRFSKSKNNVGSGASGKAEAELAETGRDFSRAKGELERVEESTERLTGAITESAEAAGRLTEHISKATGSADRLGSFDDEHTRITRENSDIIDELISRIRDEDENTEDDNCDSSYPF